MIPALGSCAARMTSGERRLAERLEQRLDDDYLLWYDVPVGPKQTHPDFVIIHPRRGLLILETKDWRLDTIQKANKQYWEIAPGGEPKVVINPLAQARHCAIQVVNALERDSVISVELLARGAPRPEILGIFMPGAYAHIAIVNEAREHAEAAGLGMEALVSLGQFLKFVELGAVSPDYPYLALRSGQSKWADNMHYTRTAKLMQAGVQAVAALPAKHRPKATAWLLGFGAHVATDMTIHPVVELRVGPYHGNEAEHRRCEMHQDAFIFPRVMQVGPTALTEHLATGIGDCHDPKDKNAIDPVVGQVWMEMLKAAYPDGGPEDQPDIGAWHSGFRRVLMTMAGINHLVPIARHVGVNLNLTYPREDDIDDSYILQLRTPEGQMDYETIYRRALNNVLSMWKGLDVALAAGGSESLESLEDWNLDTGRSVQTGRLVFWQEA